MRKVFQEIHSDSFQLGNISFGEKGASAHAEAKNQVLHVSKVMCLASTSFGWSSPQNLLRCSCSRELLQPLHLSVYTPSNYIPWCHSLQPTKLLFLSDDALHLLPFGSVKVVSQDI